MKRTISTPATLLRVMLALALVIALVPSFGAQAAGTGDTYVYIPTVDLSNAAAYEGDGVVAPFNDTFSGGTEATNPTVLLQQSGDFVEYTVNLDDSVESALLKIYQMDGIVSVKAKGGEYVTLTARNHQGGGFNRNVGIYELTAENALADASREFTIRIASAGGAVVINGIVVDAETEYLADSYELNILGESYLQAVCDVSQPVTRYFDQGKIPALHINNGGHVTFKMNFAPDGTAYTLQYANLGAEMTAEVSLDGAAWVAMTGDRVDQILNMEGTGTYYVRFSGNAGDTFLTSVTAKREAPVVEPDPTGDPIAVVAALMVVSVVGCALVSKKKYF